MAKETKKPFNERIKKYSGIMELLRTLIGIAILTLNAIYVYHQIYLK